MHNIDIVKLVCKELGKSESLITYVTDRKGHVCVTPLIRPRYKTNWAGCRKRSSQTGLKEQSNGIWSTATGGKRLFLANTSIIMKKCTSIDEKIEICLIIEHVSVT